MENSAYAPNPLPPPALVVFSQAGGLSDALRMQRPYPGIQRDENKEIVSGSGGLCGGFGFRLMESYPLLPQFLPDYPRQSLFPFSGFSHPGQSSSVTAVTPPSDMFPVSPVPTGLPSAKDDDDDSRTTPRSDTSSPVESEGRGFRPMLQRRLVDLEGRSCCSNQNQISKKKSTDPSCCPVCSVTIRPGDLDSHFIQELERLYKLSNGKRERRGPREATPSSTEGGGSIDSRWETYQRIRANRQSRLRIKNRKRKQDDVVCPVCNEGVSGTIDQLNHHVEVCLRKSGSNDEEEQVDVEGDEVYEEYEWAGQRRIRASSLLIGGYAGAGLVSNSRGGDLDDEGDLVVDGDDSATFGPTQYSEADIVPISSQSKNFQTLRDALISPESCHQISVKEEPGNGDKKSQASCDEEEENDTNKLPSSQVVEALKARVRQLENDPKKGSKCICLICMENYKKPLVSICCWHVHCEQCWLHTLGAKKLCPQCNMITSPTDLRRIFL